MKELKCPKCGNAFTVDEADYAFILQQVKTSESNAEVEKRLKELQAGEAAQRELALAEQKAETKTALDAKEREIASLKLALQSKESEAKSAELQKKLEVQQAVARKEDEIVQLKAEIDGKEKAHQVDLVKNQMQQQQALADKDAEIANDKAEDLTIRKLTRGNPTMKAMFAAVADKSVDEQEVPGGEETV